MVSYVEDSDDSSLIKSLLEWIVDVGINGMGFLRPAKEVAEDYLSKNATAEEAIDSLIAWRTACAAGTGFVTGVGGIAAMPITIPAGLAASYAIGANTAAAIAYIRGYDIHSDQVRTMILCCLILESAEGMLKTAGIAAGKKVGQNAIKQIPGKVLIEINKKIGFRLITKAGEKGVVNLTKLVPLVGGFMGGAFDSKFVNICGKIAKKVFP